MNERILELAEQADEYADNKIQMPGEYHPDWHDTRDEKFAELIVRECIGILETEIELVEGYKSTACNDFDEVWHQGKIEHFTKLVKKSKKHFGVEE
jgi:hypothetical protein